MRTNSNCAIRSIFTVRNSSCGKVMFSQASVIMSRKRRGERSTPPRQTPLGRHPSRQTPPPTHTHKKGQCSGRYASYWNAFLFAIMTLQRVYQFTCELPCCPLPPHYPSPPPKDAPESVTDPAAGRGGRETWNLCVAAFGGHLFMTYFYRTRGGTLAAPPPESATESWS